MHVATALRKGARGRGHQPTERAGTSRHRGMPAPLDAVTNRQQIQNLKGFTMRTTHRLITTITTAVFVLAAGAGVAAADSPAPTGNGTTITFDGPDISLAGVHSGGINVGGMAIPGADVGPGGITMDGQTTSADK